jgi:hypothetical protein
MNKYKERLVELKKRLLTLCYREIINFILLQINK